MCDEVLVCDALDVCRCDFVDVGQIGGVLVDITVDPGFSDVKADLEDFFLASQRVCFDLVFCALEFFGAYGCCFEGVDLGEDLGDGFSFFGRVYDCDEFKDAHVVQGEVIAVCACEGVVLFEVL